MSKKKLSKLLALYLPYVVIGLVATNLGEAWRLAAGKELGDKIVSLMGTLPAAFANPQKRQEVPAWHGVRLCPVGHSEGYRAIYGSKVRGQYHPDQNRTADDVQPPT